MKTSTLTALLALTPLTAAASGEPNTGTLTLKLSARLGELATMTGEKTRKIRKLTEQCEALHGQARPQDARIFDARLEWGAVLTMPCVVDPTTLR